MHQSMYLHDAQPEAHHYGGNHLPTSQWAMAQQDSSYVSHRHSNPGAPPQQHFMNCNYQLTPPSYDDHCHYLQPHPVEPHPVVSPVPGSRLVTYQYRGYESSHQAAEPYDHQYAGRPIVSPPMKQRFVLPQNDGPEGNRHVDGQSQFSNYHGPIYPRRRCSEDASLSSHSSQRSNEMVGWSMRKVSLRADSSFFSSSTATKAEAKLLLDTTAALCREVQRNATESSCPFADQIRGCDFVSLDLYGTVPDSLFLSMAQMKTCRLNDEDRFGNYKHRKLGMIGMACKHCGGLSGFGRHFPSSFQSLLSGSHCVRIVKHMRSECKACPPEIRRLVLEVDQENDHATFNHGSRKRFVAHVWSQLQRSIDNKDLTDEPLSSPDSSDDLDDSARSAKAQLMDEDGIPWESIVQQSELVEAKDRHLVPDSTFFAISQMKPYALREVDRIGRHKDQPLGFMGMCCAHCGGKAGKPRYGRFFPSSLKTMAKPASCERIANHFSNNECTACPTEIKVIMHKLLMRELSESNRYGSRNIFFQRLWNRLHQNEDSSISSEVSVPTDGADIQSFDGGDRSGGPTSQEWDIILRGSGLVSSQDIGLVSDSQLASIAQLAPCRLTMEDRFGWYKNRKLGFGGLACRHCGGRKGAGRYFPNALRTFAQNNYCQIVGNHIARDCTACPDEVRDVFANIVQGDKGRNWGPAFARGSYVKGSRKHFYQRIWKQIHKDGDSLTLPTHDEKITTKKRRFHQI